MKNAHRFPAVLVLAAGLAAAAASAQDAFPVFRGPYLGQEPPGRTARLFAPGIVSTEAKELNATFSPGGDELYFTETISRRHTLMTIRGGRRQAVPFSGDLHDN